MTPQADEIRTGILCDILFIGMHKFMGFYVSQDGDRRCFFCFDCECQGDYLYFHIDEIIVVERVDNNPPAIARAIYLECDRILPFIVLMKWDNNAEFVLTHIHKELAK